MRHHFQAQPDDIGNKSVPETWATPSCRCLPCLAKQELHRVRHLVVFAAVALLSLAETESASAAHCGPNACHWGSAGNCRFSSASQCVQDNVWAGLLDLCTPPVAHISHRRHRAQS